MRRNTTYWGWRSEKGARARSCSPLDARATQPQSDLLSREPANLLSVESPGWPSRREAEVDQPSLEGLLLGEGAALAHRLFRERDVPATVLGQECGSGGEVALRLLQDDFSPLPSVPSPRVRPEGPLRSGFRAPSADRVM